MKTNLKLFLALFVTVLTITSGAILLNSSEDSDAAIITTPVSFGTHYIEPSDTHIDGVPAKTVTGLDATYVANMVSLYSGVDGGIFTFDGPGYNVFGQRLKVNITGSGTSLTLNVFAEGQGTIPLGTYYATIDTYPRLNSSGDQVILRITLTLVVENAQPTTATVTFNSNTGSGTIDNRTVSLNSTMILPSTGFTKAGHYLSGWRLNSPTGTHFDLAGSRMITANTTFYAEWTQDPSNTINAPRTGKVNTLYSFSVSNTQFPFGLYYVALPGDMSVGYIVVDSAPTWLTVSKSGSNVVFSGTPNAAGLFVIRMHVAGIPPQSQAETYIFWTIAVENPALTTPYRVSFDANGGSGDHGGYTVENNTLITLPSSGFERQGFSLVGWQTTVNSAQAVFLLGQNYTVTANVSFRAYWVADPNIVIFDLAGGNGSIPPFIAYTGDVITLPSSGLAKAGHTFRGWYDPTDPSAIYAPGYMLTVQGALRLVAYWVPTSASTISITYNSNGGTGTLAQIVEPNKSVYMPIYGFTKSESNLGGWNAGSTSGTLHEVGSKVKVTTTTTFYASWIANVTSVTVAFDTNGGIGAYPVINVNAGTPISEPSPPTKYSNVFSGWKVVGGAQWNFSNPVTGSMTLQAQWQTHVSIEVDGLTIKLTMHPPYVGGYTSTILWGDGTQSQGNNVTYTHTYASPMSGLIDVTSKANTVEIHSATPFSVNDNGGGGGDDDGDDGGNDDDKDDTEDRVNWIVFAICLFMLTVGSFFVMRLIGGWVLGWIIIWLIIMLLGAFQ